MTKLPSIGHLILALKLLIGDKHGSKRFKPTIAKEEFDSILGLTEHIELSYQSTVDSLLRSFYEFDDNYIGNKFYRLRDFEVIKSKLGLAVGVSSDLTRQGFSSLTLSPLKHNDEQLKWKILRQQILDLMCEAADICFQNGELSEEERNKYFMSGTKGFARFSHFLINLKQNFN
jgi:hypothetical protein